MTRDEAVAAGLDELLEREQAALPFLRQLADEAEEEAEKCLEAVRACRTLLAEQPR